MKELQIGQEVIVKAVSSVGYDEDGNRRTFRDEVPSFRAVVTGQKRKQLGKYKSGYTVGGYTEPYDVSSPYLEQSGTVLFWCVRRRMAGREILVEDEDLELENEESIRSQRPGDWSGI